MRPRLLLALLLALEAGCAARPPPPPIRLAPHHPVAHHHHAHWHARRTTTLHRHAPPEGSCLSATRVRCSAGDASACRLLRAMLQSGSL